jgi:hypothetical protein
MLVHVGLGNINGDSTRQITRIFTPTVLERTNVAIFKAGKYVFWLLAAACGSLYPQPTSSAAGNQIKTTLTAAPACNAPSCLTQLLPRRMDGQGTTNSFSGGCVQPMYSIGWTNEGSDVKRGKSLPFFCMRQLEM